MEEQFIALVRFMSSHAYLVVLLLLLVVLGLVAYMLTHLPQLIHSPKPKIGFKHGVVAHRGSAVSAPGFIENSLAAMRAAVRNGADAVLLDVRTTKDGVPVVFSDQSLQRLAGVEATVEETNFANLPRLLHPANLKSAADGEKKTTTTTKTKTSSSSSSSSASASASSASKDESAIPTLEEALAAVGPDVGKIIVLRSESPDLVKAVAEILRVRDDQHSSFAWGSFSHNINNACIKENMPFPTIFSAQRIQNIYYYFYCGLLPFVSVPEQIFLIPITYRGSDMLQPTLFWHLNARRTPVIVFGEDGGLNNPADVHRSCEKFVNGICTDDVVALRKLLN